MRRMIILWFTCPLWLTCGRDWNNPVAKQNVFQEKLPTEGLVAYYPFNGNAQDASGYGNHATVAGPQLGSDRFGQPARCVTFDGTDDRITLPIGLIASCMPVTITAWIKTTRTGAVIGYQDVAYPEKPQNFVPLLYADLTGKVRGLFWPGPANKTSFTLSSASAFNDNRWHFVIITATATNQYLYCDSRMEASSGGSVNFLSMVFDQIGAAYSSNWPGAATGWMMFSGSIDDIRIYNRALTEAEMQVLYYEGGFIPPLETPRPRAVGITDASIKISWPEVPVASQYMLEQAAEKTGPFSSLYTGRDTLYLHSGLARAQRVWYRVKAQNGSRSSAWSDTVASVALSFEGWTRNPANGHYYLFITGLDWPPCKAKAESLGAQLVTIRNSSEKSWLTDTFRISDSDVRCAAWIGLTDDGHEGNWQWLSGEPVTYINWAPGEPNNGSGVENYATMDFGNRYGHLGQWNDLWYKGSGNVRGALIERLGGN